jgi:urease accessory protein
MTINIHRVVASAFVLALASVPAFAHHPMGGATPSTFGAGLLSGLGHPIIGLAISARGFAVATAFLTAMIGGVVLHLMSTALPAAEILVGLTTVLMGLLVAIRFRSSLITLAALFTIAGLAHGYALGEAVVGAEPAPIGAYLAGLFVIQTVIAGGAYLATASLADAGARRTAALALSGGIVMIAGGLTAASAAGFLG